MNKPLRTIIRRKVRSVGEVCLAALAIGVVPLLPRWVIPRLARVLGAAAFFLSARLRRVAVANVNAALGTTLSVQDRRRIVRESFRTAALTILDVFWFSRHRKERIRRFFRFGPSAECGFVLSPVVFLTAHYGSWELLGKAYALRSGALLSVARPLKNRVIDRFMNREREQTGQRITPRKGALRVLLRALRSGVEPVALLVDQNTQPDEGGEFVRLFGMLAPMTKAPAALASRASAHLIFEFCGADARGVYTAEALEPIPPATLAEWGGEATQHVARMLETAIRRHPGQWLWMYKRWKVVPHGEPVERYPFYAKRMEP